jgi:hypothetical protein
MSLGSEDSVRSYVCVKSADDLGDFGGLDTHEMLSAVIKPAGCHDVQTSVCQWFNVNYLIDVEVRVSEFYQRFHYPFLYRLPHRALAALAAIWDRLRGDSAAALASPPFKPPNRPSATALGFLVGSRGFGCGWVGSNFGAWPVDSSMI